MDIRTVGVVGCGLMGVGIVEVCARAGYDVVVREINDDLPKISAAGGNVLMPKTEIPQTGWFAIFSDPTGMVNALYQTLPRRTQAAPRKKARRGAKKARSARGSRKRRK